ncbi:unnamed protein product, partial [Mesorhabditis belari]|uniref:RING finger and SPRY domain-containing protein 1 n=1 Tax=Mesorhabditis belari TaxID=2138241 RepID=A0AAF3J293_9BILA
MGSCVCRQKNQDPEQYAPSGGDVRAAAERLQRRRRRNSLRSTDETPYMPTYSGDASFESTYFESPNVKNDIKELIKQTLVVIRSLVNNDQEPPSSLLKLNMIADKEKGWLLVVKSLVEAVPDEDPLGPAVITLFLDESPLPTREAVGRLLFSFSLNTPECSSQPSFWHRNACIVLGSLAEKLAGASSVSMCTPSVLQYLIKNLNPSYPRQVILFSLIALEKFAQTTENRHIITKALENGGVHPLEDLEQILYDTSLSNDWLAQQVGFCAQWSLDNIFVRPGRVYSYKRTDVSSINAMLNHEDVSEYLKISPDGLEARCDVSSFESVRCTFEVNEGIWYYEATVLTPGVMQIGFATKRSRFLNHEGYGIGDDENSVAYDGCRQLLWHNAHSSRHDHQPWKAGDVVGCLLNLPKSQVIFYLNGKPLTRPHTAFLLNRCSVDGIFAAASFMSFQHCRFNFGNSSFAFPPKGLSFRTFNEAGVKLTDSQKTILPRRCRLEMIQKVAIPDDYCNICYANPADTTLIPCSHGDLCSTCALQLESCPICRSAIFQRNSIPKSSSTQSAPNFGSNDIHTTV